MASHKQREANQRNAKRSTGPKSDAGKARARINSLKHGFSSQEIVLEGEDADQFDALREQLEAEFDPDSVIERELVDRLAILLWRLRRVPVFEAALIRARRGSTPTPGYHRYRMENETIYISDDGMKDIDAFLELERDVDPSPSGTDPSTQAAPSGPSSAGTSEPNANETLRSSGRTMPDPAHEARVKRDHPHQLSSQATGLALIKDSEDHDTLSKLSRYEAGLMNAINKTLSLLQALRSSGLLDKKK